MDRTLVLTKGTKQDVGYGMNYRCNIPFGDIPRELVEQLANRNYTYEEYLKMCPFMDLLPTYWNFVVDGDDGEIVAFVWGVVEPLERLNHIVRISVLPSVRNKSDATLFYAAEIVKEACEHMGVNFAYCITDRPEIYFNKSEGPIRMKVSNNTLMEVRLYENLH